jgi:hypothetical protein
MYYKELYFQGSTIRFVNTYVVIEDIYSLFNQHYLPHKKDAYVISSKNLKESPYLKETKFELLSFHQVNILLNQFKANNIPVEIFRNWLSNFAYVYIEDFIANNDKQEKLEELQETVTNLQNENTELKATLSKCVSDISNQNFSLDILSKVLQLDIDVRTGVTSSVEFNNIKKDIKEIKSILCEQVGLDYEEEGEKESIEDELAAAFEPLKAIYGVFYERAFNLHFLRAKGYNLMYRANNRGISLFEYIASDKNITKLVLDYIPELI